jgi:hypothetical protein
MRLQRTIREERKRRKLQARYGTEFPVCPVCGCDDPYAFDSDDGHHVAGKDYGDWTTPICKNCHARQTANQYDYPRRAPTKHVRMARHLYGFLDLLEAAIPHLRAVADHLMEMDNAPTQDAARHAPEGLDTTPHRR